MYSIFYNLLLIIILKLFEILIIIKFSIYYCFQKINWNFINDFHIIPYCFLLIIILCGVVYMQFSSKFSLMLNIFDVKNLDLADEISIDRTLISKWRSGQRKPATDSEQMVQLSKYFAKLLCKNENASLFKTAFGLDDDLTFPDNDDLCKLLTDWFRDDSKNMNDLIHGVSLHGQKQIITSHNDLLPSPILYFEGFEGYVDASNYLKCFLNDGDKTKIIRICMDYRMHMYLISLKKTTIYENTLIKHAIKLGYQIEVVMNVSEHNLHYCMETFASLLTKDHYKYISLYCYDLHTPAPNHFIIIDDEVIEYGSFSDNVDFAPIISHVTTYDGILKMFRHTYDNLLRYSHPVNLAKYVL